MRAAGRQPGSGCWPGGIDRQALDNTDDHKAGLVKMGLATAAGWQIVGGTSLYRLYQMSDATAAGPSHQTSDLGPGSAITQTGCVLACRLKPDGPVWNRPCVVSGQG